MPEDDESFGYVARSDNDYDHEQVRDHEHDHDHEIDSSSNTNTNRPVFKGSRPGELTASTTSRAGGGDAGDIDWNAVFNTLTQQQELEQQPISEPRLHQVQSEQLSNIWQLGQTIGNGNGNGQTFPPQPEVTSRDHASTSQGLDERHVPKPDEWLQRLLDDASKGQDQQHAQLRQDQHSGRPLDGAQQHEWAVPQPPHSGTVPPPRSRQKQSQARPNESWNATHAGTGEGGSRQETSTSSLTGAASSSPSVWNKLLLLQSETLSESSKGSSTHINGDGQPIGQNTHFDWATQQLPAATEAHRELQQRANRSLRSRSITGRNDIRRATSDTNLLPLDTYLPTMPTPQHTMSTPVTPLHEHDHHSTASVSSAMGFFQALGATTTTTNLVEPWSDRRDSARHTDGVGTLTWPGAPAPVPASALASRQSPEGPPPNPVSSAMNMDVDIAMDMFRQPLGHPRHPRQHTQRNSQLQPQHPFLPAQQDQRRLHQHQHQHQHQNQHPQQAHSSFPSPPDRPHTASRPHSARQPFNPFGSFPILHSDGFTPVSSSSSGTLGGYTDTPPVDHIHIQPKSEPTSRSCTPLNIHTNPHASPDGTRPSLQLDFEQSAPTWSGSGSSSNLAAEIATDRKGKGKDDGRFPPPATAGGSQPLRRMTVGSGPGQNHSFGHTHSHSHSQSVSVAQASEESEEVTPDFEDKRARNTLASAKFRAKKKQHLARVERTITALEDRQTTLRREVNDLHKENKFLREMVQLKYGVNADPNSIAASAADGPSSNGGGDSTGTTGRGRGKDGKAKARGDIGK